MITGFQGHFSSETPTRTVSVNCMQCLLLVKQWPIQKNLHISAKYQLRRCISDSCRCYRQTIFQSFVDMP